MNGLPTGWDFAQFGDIVDVLDSRRVPVNAVERAKRQGDVPYYGATGQVGWIDAALFDEDLVLLGEDGAPFLDPTKQKAYLVHGPSWVNNHAHVVRARPDATSNRFLKYALDAADYRPHVYGTTRLKLTQKSMCAMSMPLPPFEEQERIVAAIEEHLSRLDAAEHALRSAHTRLATFRSSTTSEALGGDWPVVRLGDHTVDQRYGSSAKAERDGDVPVLRMGNIVDGCLDFADLKYLPVGHPDLETCTLAAMDLLFNRTNSPELVGKSAVFEGRSTPVAFASYLIRVRLDEELDPHWVTTAINSPAGRRFIDTVRTQQVGQANVNGTKLKDFPIPMPSIEVQRKRLTQLDQARAWLRGVEAEIKRALTRASALRRSILRAAFSGQLVPQRSRR